MKLKGRRVLITGGGTGVGAGVALAFAREGCQVAITGRREDRLREVANRWKGDPKILYHPADVGDRESVSKLFQWAAEDLGPIDILVHSAGTNIPQRAVADISPEDWDLVLKINATGAFNCIHAVLPQMRDRRDGVIINIGSIAAKRAGPLGGVAYNASKFAMGALGITVGIEERDNNIRVTNIHPGEINTEILEKRPVAVSDEHKAQILQPEDFGEVCILLATLPSRANIPELIIKPTSQPYA
jgi:NAD(P)-dependent dehydrogenase (short-subunit alcohol dehydrogenase family)